MDDELFDWDDANILHLAEHDVEPEEAEEVILWDPLELDFATSEPGEDRWSYVGESLEGRILQVVITTRGKKIRVVTAFDSTRQDKLVYLRWKAEQQ